jgi:hypothetical protein
MEHLRNVLDSLRGSKIKHKQSSAATRTHNVTRYNGPDVRKRLHLAFLILVVGFAIGGPVTSITHAQTSGSAPVFNATVQGQSASTVEGTFANVVNYVGNVICPIGAGLMVAATVVQVKSGKNWMPTGLTAIGLLGVSGILRLLESMVQNGQSAVK